MKNQDCGSFSSAARIAAFYRLGIASKARNNYAPLVLGESGPIQLVREVDQVTGEGHWLGSLPTMESGKQDIAQF